VGASSCRAPIEPEQSRHHLEVLAPAHRRLDRRELPGETDHAPDRAGLFSDVVPDDAERSRVEPQ
jgi:hypothetical protein